MVNVFERNMKVDASLTDVNIQFGLLPALTVAQDNMCEYFRQIGCDGITMIPVKNCFFVLTKSKIKFDNFATWLDEFKVSSSVLRLPSAGRFPSESGLFQPSKRHMQTPAFWSSKRARAQILWLQP